MVLKAQAQDFSSFPPISCSALEESTALSVFSFLVCAMRMTHGSACEEPGLRPAWHRAHNQ